MSNSLFKSKKVNDRTNTFKVWGDSYENWTYCTVYKPYFAVIPLFNGKTLGSALLRFKLSYEKQRISRTVLRGLFITSYFYLIPDGLLFLTNEFNKTPDSMLFLALFPILFAALILFFIITVVLMQMNKRFLFDRLFGSFYKSMVQNGQPAEIDTVEAKAETQAEAEKDI